MNNTVKGAIVGFLIPFTISFLIDIAPSDNIVEVNGGWTIFGIFVGLFTALLGAVIGGSYDKES